ncbi:MAG: hypothetical protein P1U74_05600 [Legionellaceae bacterium]|nr:hypothetical protein [Legionellaceae bacterium]
MDKDSSINTAKIEKELISKLESVGLALPVVNVKKVQKLERHAQTGKLKRFNTLQSQINKKDL